MIDIHCHIVPDIDDGASDMNEALSMARLALDNETNTIINTSHFNPVFNYTSSTKLKKAVEVFNNVLSTNNIDLQVLLGNELYYNKELMHCLDKKEFFCLNNSDYILVEFSNASFPSNILDVVYEFVIRGYIPILAHVERYPSFAKNLKLVQKCIECGALIQVNSSSVLGSSSSSSQESVLDLIDNNMVHFVASDGHGSTRRRPILKNSYDFISGSYSKELADKLFFTNPQAVIDNEKIDLSEVYIPSKKLGFFKRLFSR